MKNINDIDKNPFSIPSAYFDNMQEQVLAQVKLPLASKQQGTIPDQYFASMQQEVLTKVATSSKIVHFSYKKWIGAAASLVLLIGATMWLWPNMVQPTSGVLAGLSPQESLELVAFMSDELSLSDYAELITEEDLLTDITEEEEYLYLESLDVDQLIELENTL